MKKEIVKWGFWKFWRESIRFWSFFDISNPYKVIKAYGAYEILFKQDSKSLTK